MYTIRQASIRSGVGVPLIRAWERRYGLVEPTRTAAGYRLYDDAAIARLIQVRQMTAAGWSASEASRAILAGEVPGTREASLAGTDARVGLSPRFVEAAARRDMAAVTSILDELFAVGSYELVVDELLMPMLVALGAAWADGRVDVAGEHATSAAVQRRLAALYEAAAVGAGPRAVVGLPPGARHELGALAFAVAVRRTGAGVLYLGADVPVDSWVSVMRDGRHRLAVIGVVRDEDRAAALDVVRALQTVEGKGVLLGGGAATWDGGTRAGAIILPEGIGEAATTVASMLARRSVAPAGRTTPPA